MKQQLKLLILFFIIFLSCSKLTAQKAYITTYDTLFEIKSVNGQCQLSPILPLCNLPENFYKAIGSIAIHRDTLYYIAGPSKSLVQVVLGNPNSCTNLVTFPTADNIFNSLTTDKEGLVYAIESVSRKFFRYNPYTNELKLLGILPEPSGGDLMFFKTKLLYSTVSQGIYEIDMTNPALSKQYMETPGYSFFGLMSMPFNCNSNKIFGMSSPSSSKSTEFIELDLENRKLLGSYCTFPFYAFDAASNVDNGNSIGISLDSLLVKIPCTANTAGTELRIKAYSATEGLINYTLDGTTTNNTGIFNNISFGDHQIHLSNSIGCIKDTTVNVPYPLSGFHSLTTTPAISCEQSTGTINVNSLTGYPPLLYQLDSGQFQPNNNFTRVRAGLHTIAVKDALGCRKDTVAHVGYENGSAYIQSINVQPTSCKQTGRINIILSPGTNNSSIQISLNGGAYTNVLQYDGLDSGFYRLIISNGTNCAYDTFVNIIQIKDNEPLVSITTTDQFCFANNGKVEIKISGNETPYLINFNNSSFSTTSNFQYLAPGQYPIYIKNINDCQWNFIAEINSYKKNPVTYQIDKINPDCDIINNGRIRLNVLGNESPYTVLVNNKEFNNNTWINDLNGAKYLLQFKNKDGCIVDTFQLDLQYNFKPVCDTFYMPTAFTPNSDGLNDYIKPIANPLLMNMQFSLYNRFGQKIYEGNHQSKGWDGNIKGKLQPAGTYVWQITYKNYLGQLKQNRGTFLLVR